MTRRPTASEITDDQLDALYTERDRYRLAWQSARDRADAQGFATRSARLEARCLRREIDRMTSRTPLDAPTDRTA